jgi:hypothetical protein
MAAANNMKTNKNIANEFSCRASWPKVPLLDGDMGLLVDSTNAIAAIDDGKVEGDIFVEEAEFEGMEMNFCCC